jgi:predicted alpha/beta superfamily hydrolase
MKGLRLFLILFTAFVQLTACMSKKNETPIQLVHYPDFASSYVVARNVEVMLPPGYSAEKAYDVIYMHDGQNIFNPETSYAGVAWEVDKAIIRLIEEEKIRPSIIVAIWNTPKRMQEYMPAKPSDLVSYKAEKARWDDVIISDNYLKFIVTELKPFIDNTYSTRPNRESTFVMGSSMGGLISLYALTEYPEVFGGAGCISAHWLALDGVFLDYVKNNLPQPGNHKIYFDYGTETLDAQYEPFQQKVDKMMEDKGFTKGKDWLTLKFQGADHSEKAWKERVHIPLEFFLSKE